MPHLTTQQALRIARNLPFCYLCGQGFATTDDVNDDHLPPKVVFDKQDRNPPLILPVHQRCNELQSRTDEELGQFFDFVKGRDPVPNRRKIDALPPDTLDGYMVCRRLNFQTFIGRCVRGFHATLYQSWIPENMEHAFHPPVIGAVFNEKGRPTDSVQAMLVKDDGLQQHATFVSILKQNRLAKTTDAIISNNGQCRYECVWGTAANGNAVCFFGLKLYEWQTCGDLLGYQPRGCVGLYSVPSGIPEKAATITPIQFDFPNSRPLDPFGD